MKNLFTTLLIAVVCASASWAEGLPALNVNSAEGSTQILIADISQVTFSSTEMSILLASDTSLSFPNADNWSISFNNNGTGGSTSSVTGATQAFATASRQNITANQYLSLQKSDGTVICSYKVPKTQSATIVVSSPEFVSGTSYKLVLNSTAVNNPSKTYLGDRFTIGGTLTGGSATNITPKTK